MQMVRVLRGHPAQYVRCLRPRLSRPLRGASPGWQIRERHRPWPRGRARLGSHDMVRLRSELPSHASLHRGRSMVAITVRSNSYVTGMDAASTVSTCPPAGCGSPAGPRASTLLPRNLPWPSSWACAQWNEQVILARRRQIVYKVTIILKSMVFLIFVNIHDFLTT